MICFWLRGIIKKSKSPWTSSTTAPTCPAQSVERLEALHTAGFDYAFPGTGQFKCFGGIRGGMMMEVHVKRHTLLILFQHLSPRGRNLQSRNPPVRGSLPRERPIRPRSRPDTQCLPTAYRRAAWLHRSDCITREDATILRVSSAGLASAAFVINERNV